MDAGRINSSLGERNALYISYYASITKDAHVGKEKNYFGKIFNFHWSIIDLQCCVSLWCTAK